MQNKCPFGIADLSRGPDTAGEMPSPVFYFYSGNTARIEKMKVLMLSEGTRFISDSYSSR
jgi:hypothetical protein